MPCVLLRITIQHRVISCNEHSRSINNVNTSHTHTSLFVFCFRLVFKCFRIISHPVVIYVVVHVMQASDALYYVLYYTRIFCTSAQCPGLFINCNNYCKSLEMSLPRVFETSIPYMIQYFKGQSNDLQIIQSQK